MKIENWSDEYGRIAKQLELDKSADILSAEQLQEYLHQFYSDNSELILKNLSRILKKPVLIAGAGPSLETDVRKVKNLLLSDRVNLIAVDGTCSLFHELNIVPNIVVTDLDGEWASIKWAIHQGTVALLHGHGDNSDLIKAFFSENKKQIKGKKLWGTTQNDIESDLFNFGGFTDGDRAIFLTFHFQTPIIGLIGFDFGETIGKYSCLNPFVKKDLKRKQAKFQIAINLIGTYHHEHLGKKYNLTDSGETIPGFPKISSLEFETIVAKWYEMKKK
jgi:uncharacterized Rossmann fold enzyme